MASHSTSRPRSNSVLSRPSRQYPVPLNGGGHLDPLRQGSPNSSAEYGRQSYRQRSGSTASGTHTSSSPFSKTPARSFFHRSFNGPLPIKDPSQQTSEEVREQTAELASWALSDAASIRSATSPPPHHLPSHSYSSADTESHISHDLDVEDRTPRATDAMHHPEPIVELSEPASPISTRSSQSNPVGQSALTEMLLNSSPDCRDLPQKSNDRTMIPENAAPAVTVTDEDPPQAEETTALLHSQRSSGHNKQGRAQIPDLENQMRPARRKVGRALAWTRDWASTIRRTVVNPKGWDRRVVWKRAVVQPASYIPAVILGLLLNILDALSYGMILFPLGQPIFSELGPDGISMFYVSCIISQLVYSCGGSVFKGGIGSEMIEVVPFFHQMALNILDRVGEENSKSVLATTILSFAISAVLTGLVFFLMGICRLGRLIGFFPRHILIGCIGGVGWFLVATGIEVSARLEGNLDYNIATLRKLFELDTLFLWLVPLLLAVILLIAQRWVKSPLFVPGYFMVIPAVFYFFVAAIPELDLVDLRQRGWVFEMPASGVPFYHFYTLYDFRAVDWNALVSNIPAMFALTFFGILHVPINVPALGFSCGEDNVNVDRELIAHGISNAVSGLAGSVQNYLVYTNSLLFMRSGGDSRIAGVMLAIGTCGILAAGPTIIGYIPIMVVGALIFLLGIDLMREALFDTWGRVHRLEYVTIVIIVVTMGAWDFVYGILVGIILACVNYVVQTSRKSAIRATYTGEVAGSTVRRHPIQQRYLREVGRQTLVLKLAGFLFFGTIANVEDRIRALLDDETFREQPIRYLVLDLSHVTGVDFSAAEAFTRINRVLQAKGVEMLISGTSLQGEVGQSLRNVGLFDEEKTVKLFSDLNSALEYCENELLKAFYRRKDAMGQRNHPQSQRLNVPSSEASAYPQEVSYNSPRRQYLQHVATTTLKEAPQPTDKWQSFKQPLPLILQIFQDLSDKNEDFWFRAVPYFERKEYRAGTTVFHRGDRADGFYLLEDGIFRAEYQMPQGKYYESIVAGTTCGELPFFSETSRTATVVAERDSVAWLLSEANWEKLQKEEPAVAQELLRIGLKLTSERMTAITSYVLTAAV